MRKRILVFEADTAIRDSLTRMLAQVGYEVIRAEPSGPAQAQSDLEIDLFLLDIDKVAQSGWDVFGRLSSQSPWIPIIVLTSFPEQLDPSLMPGIETVLEKPIEVQALLHSLERSFNQSISTRVNRLRHCNAISRSRRFVSG
jgi:DNA-binding response OmpR family regulator